MTSASATAPVGSRAQKRGRRHKGARHLFQSRVPVELAETVMAEAENAGLTYSEYIAVVLAERHHFELPPEHFEPKGRRARQDAPDGTVQEEIAMQIAV